LPLLIVPVAASDAGLLTLDEWDALSACDKVFFETPDHPLMPRLAAAGIACGPFDDEPSAAFEGSALVADPWSRRVLELARDGARVSVGPAIAPDSLSAAHGASVARSAARSLATVAVVMARLRSEDGCPWDRQQSHSSLEVHLLEESHEVIDAIERGDIVAGLREELGDLLLQVAFHSRIAQQDDRFDLPAVADTLTAKLIHRHPHVFGDVSVSDADEVLRNWEALKQSEKSRDGAFDDLPASLPALLGAYKTQKRASGLGFSASLQEAMTKLGAALEVGDFGDALFWLVAAARSRGVDPETALLAATARFRADLGPKSNSL
jgi:XTP/dITP diphosphohydrolase